jgi:hypothetical protein
MTCGATGWLFWQSRMPGWRPGVPDQGSRTAGCPLPYCRKAGRGARTHICCGVQPCGSVPMMTGGAGPRTSRNPDAGMIPKNPPLPARRRGGANHPNPVACGIEQPRGRADLIVPLALLQASGFGQADAKAAALITASAEHWTSQATCLSDSRSLSAPAVARGLAEHSLTFSHTPAPVAAIPPPSLSCPIRQCSKSASVANTTRQHADTRRTGTVSFHHG